jgi:hypothetical protein
MRNEIQKQRHQEYKEKIDEDPNYNKKKYKERTQRANNDRVVFSKRRFAEQKSKARNKRKIPFRLDKQKTVDSMVATDHCSISGRELVFMVGHPDCPSIDRIDSKKGYTKSNIQITSAVVNRSKMDLTTDEFVQLCLDVVRHHGYRVRAK